MIMNIFPWATDEHTVLGFAKTVGVIDDFDAFEKACVNILGLKSNEDVKDEVAISDEQAWKIAETLKVDVNKRYI